VLTLLTSHFEYQLVFLAEIAPCSITSEASESRIVTAQVIQSIGTDIVIIISKNHQTVSVFDAEVGPHAIT
jgi:hypothetical protein